MLYFYRTQRLNLIGFPSTVALYSKPQVIKLIRCLPMVGGFLWVLRLLPSLKLVAMI